MRIYTADWCNPCSELKAWIKEEGKSHLVQILDIDKDTCILSEIQKCEVLPTLFHGDQMYVGREEIKPLLSGAIYD